MECVLDDLLVFMTNGSSAKQFKENVGYPISRIETIWNWEIDYDRVKYTKHNNTLIFRFKSEVEPIQPIRLKVEINCREHFTVLGWKEINHSVQNSWFSGESKIITYELEELLGTKLRALYQRTKGRDLFDLYYALTNKVIDPHKIIQCYNEYMIVSDGKAATSREFILNMDEKMKDDSFKGDIVGLIRPGIHFNIDDAYKLIKQVLLQKI